MPENDLQENELFLMKLSQIKELTHTIKNSENKKKSNLEEIYENKIKIEQIKK